MEKHLHGLCTWLDNTLDIPMLLGMDGFIDSMLHVVDTRTNSKEYTRIETIEAYSKRIASAAGLSTNIELVEYDTRLGGNGPNMAAALLEYGAKLSYFGTIGTPDDISPVFRNMARRCHAVYPLGDPGLTDALEFLDGKLIIGKHSALLDLDWQRVKEAFGGAEEMARVIDKNALLGIENWVMLPHMSSIWEGILEEVFPHLSLRTCDERPYAFFDLCDPAKRTASDISHAMKILGRFGTHFKVVLGLNGKELFEVSEALGIHPIQNTKDADELNKSLSKQLYDKLGIFSLVVHPVKEAFVWHDSEFYKLGGPYCETPLITTGAGDNFNAGFCLCLAHHRHPMEALLLGVATSGFYVRNAKCPTPKEAQTFLKAWHSNTL